MNDKSLKAIVEGLLFASGEEGLTVKQMAKITETSELFMDNIVEALAKQYELADRGIVMMRLNDRYYLTTKREHSEYIKKLIGEQTFSRLSQAALETLVIIAYEQPITRVEIEHIRGVNSDGPVQTLLARSLIEEKGRKDAIGRPILFGTSKYFLTYFGLTSLDELPPLPLLQEDNKEESETTLFNIPLDK